MRALLAASLLTLLPLAAEAVPGAVRERVAEQVAAQGRVVVVVELAEEALPEGWLHADQVAPQRRRVVDRQIRAIYDLGGTDAGPAKPYPVIPFVALEVGPSALVALEASPFVRSVRISQVDAPVLAESVPATRAPEAHAIGFDGTGQAVVVLDSGTDLGHSYFPEWKELAEACFADGATGAALPQSGGGDCPGGGDTAFGVGAAYPCDYHDDCFHGTHVAGTAVGYNQNFPGVAPGAGLIAVQVFSQFPASYPGCGGQACPRAWQHDTDAALLHVYDTLRHSHDIAAVNMSISSGAYTSNCDSSRASTKAAIDQLRSVGIATVISTGNNSCSGIGCTDAIGAPACVSSAVSVSATRDLPTIPGWANRAPFMSILAPGDAVIAPEYFTVSGLKWALGTSMAAPHVAGAWAILRQAVPDGSVSDLLQALQDTGEVVDAGQGYERIQVRDALAALGFPECDDGVDSDGDGLVDGADPGCDDAADVSERSDALPCDDGIDNDGDGETDLADPGCSVPAWPSEAPACNDGIDNDGDGGIDFDGDPADPDCAAAWEGSEASPSSCGLGPELGLVLPLLGSLRRRRRSPEGARWKGITLPRNARSFLSG